MVPVLEIVFWLSSLAVLYPYLGYPLILLLVNRYRARRGDGETVKRDEANTLPSLTMIVSAYNEEAVIDSKLRNTRALDYDQDKFELLVVSDGSTDATDAIVNRHRAEDSTIRLLRLEDRSGKTLGLNKAIEHARGDIVVFSDANAIYQRDALIELVAPFSDPRVGYTVGSALYEEESDEAVNVSEGLYWRYELWIKELESRFFSVVGGDGAIYAIRKALYKPMDKIDISDFVNPMQIVAAGYRGIFLRDARSHEGGTQEFSDEYRRKRRIVNRSWGAVRRHVGMFSLVRDRRFLFMLLSHKVIRWYSCAFVLIALLSSLILTLTTSSLFYQVCFCAILASVLVGLLGWGLDRSGRSMPKLVYLIYYFYLVGTASLMGILDDFRGTTYTVWQHVR